MTTAKTAATKSASNAVVGKQVSDKLAAGQEPKAPEQKREDKKANQQLSTISTGACVTAMTKAFGFSKQYLQIEVAIALAIFATSKGGVTKESKNAVMDVYKAAGFNADPKGDDYKTCHRRMSVSANFFTHLGVDEVQNAMEGAKEGKAIDALTKYLITEFNFKGVNDIIAATTGKKPKQTNTPAARAKREAKADVIVAAKPAEATVTDKGQLVTKEGEPDQRSAPVGDIAEGQKTRAEHGLQGTTKAEAGLAGATPADHAVMAAMGEAAQERPQAQGDGKNGRRRAADHGICLIAGKLELSIPYGTSGADIQALYAKLTVLAGSVRDETVVDEKYDRYSDSPLAESTRQVAH